MYHKCKPEMSGVLSSVCTLYNITLRQGLLLYLAIYIFIIIILRNNTRRLQKNKLLLEGRRGTRTIIKQQQQQKKRFFSFYSSQFCLSFWKLRYCFLYTFFFVFRIHIFIIKYKRQESLCAIIPGRSVLTNPSASQYRYGFFFREK